MRTARLVALLSLALHIVPARAQDTLSTTDTLAYTTTIVTVRAKPFANAESLGRVDAAAPVRLYACSDGWCSIAAGRFAGYVPKQYLSAQPTPITRRPGAGYGNSSVDQGTSPTVVQ